MFKDFLKPSWQSDSAEKRLHAVQKMNPDDDANQKIFIELVNDDSELNVRQAALDKLSKPELVWQISRAHDDKATAEYAESVFNQLIGHKSKLTETQLRDLLSSHDEIKAPIAAHCPFESLRHELFASFSEIAQAELLGSVEYVKTRKHIAEQLSTIDALETARKQLKGKDKSAEKIIRAKLDSHHTKERQEQENRSEALAVCEKMEALVKNDWDADFQAKYNIWSQRWNDLTFTPDSDISQRYDIANETVSKLVAKMLAEQETKQKQQALSHSLHKYCNKIAPLSWQALHEHQTESQTLLSNASESWLSLNKDVIAPADLSEDFLSYQSALTSVLALGKIDQRKLEQLDPDATKQLKKAIEEVQWSSKLPPLLAISEAQTTFDEFEQALIQHGKDNAAKLDKLHKRINRLLGSTKRGSLQQAKREFSAISKAAENFTGKDRTSLNDRLESAEQALKKMGDWKDFATEPKYLELCDEMELLAKLNDKTHPDALAVKIAKLQKRWKALGHSDSADKHWDRFKSAADKAYEPCARFFEQRHATRAENLKKRDPLVQKMQDLLEKTEWDAPPDYKKIESDLHAISREWQKIKDVERDAGQQQWDRLSGFKSGIYEKLDIVYDKNIELKKTIIEQAEALLEKEPNEDTINKLQLFQSRWKQVGITRRKQDQKAWKKFKAKTDAVYEKLQGSRKQKRAEEDAQLDVYRNVIKEVRKLAKNATQLAPSDSAFEQLQADYEALPPLPKSLPEKLLDGLDKDFKRAGDAYSKARTRIKQQQRDSAMQALADKAALCCDLEKASSEDEVKRISEAIGNIELSDNGLAKRFKTRLDAAQQTDRDKIASQATKTRELLCLDLEILLDVESPSEAKAQRMQLQLERLKTSGIGQAVQDQTAALRELKLDWLCLPGAEPKQQALLEKRFQAAIKQAGK